MKAKIKVTFDMSYDATSGECKTQVSFELPEHPDVKCPDSIKKLLMQEIYLICGAANAASEKLFNG